MNTNNTIRNHTQNAKSQIKHNTTSSKLVKQQTSTITKQINTATNIKQPQREIVKYI